MCTIQKYLDTLSSSKRAVHLYEKAGVPAYEFARVERMQKKNGVQIWKSEHTDRRISKR